MKSEKEFEDEDVSKWLHSNGWNEKDAKYDRMLNEVIYWEALKTNIININNITESEYYEHVEPKLKNRLTLDGSLIGSNRVATETIRSGVTYQKDGKSKDIDVIDFDNIDNNEFVAETQFNFTDDDPYRHREFDVVMFVNGIPVSVIELKSVKSHNTTIDAIKEVQNTYEERIPELFVPNLFNVVMNQNDLRYGAIGVDKDFYHHWKSESTKLSLDVKTHFKDLTDRSVLLSILKDFVFFKGNQKIIPRHQQYYSTVKVTDDVRTDGTDEHLIVHVQGSGKSYAMLYTAHIISKYYNKPVFIVVDETGIISQFRDDMRKINEVNEKIVTSENGGGERLQQIIEDDELGVIVTTIQMFNEVDKNVSQDMESVVLADEAHRYLGDILGSRMERILEPFDYYGYTGTPIEETYEMFSREDEPYLHKYSMKDGVEEDAILPVKITSRTDLLKWNVDEESMDEAIKDNKDYKKAISNVGSEDLSGVESRIDTIVDDIVKHFNEEVRKDELPFKGMVVTDSKENAARYGGKLKDKLGDDKVRVIYSESKKDSPIVQKYHNEDEHKDIIESFKQPDSDPVMLVVCDKLRTGFDAPILRTVYLDRKFNGGHTLLQTIARTNRPMKIGDVNKEFGEVIDYQGSTENFEEMVETDKEDIEKYVSEDKDKFKTAFKNKLSDISSMFNDEVNKKKQLDSEELQDRFIERFKQLKSLYKNIKPDKFIDEYQDEYREYKDLYDVVITHRRTSEQEVKDKVIDVVRSNVSVESKTDYSLESRIVENIEEDDAKPLKITRKKKTLEEIIRQNSNFDPRYDDLSERVNEIIEKWNQDIISSDDALRKLDEIMDLSDSMKEEFESSDLTERQYIVEQVLVKYIDEYNDNSLSGVAVKIVEEYEDNKPSNIKWLDSKRDKIEKEIEKVLFNSFDNDMWNNKRLIDDVINKLKRLDRY